MYKGSIDQMTDRIGKVEIMLADIEEKIEMLEKIKEWNTDEESEFYGLCQERNWLLIEYNELRGVLA